MGVAVGLGVLAFAFVLARATGDCGGRAALAAFFFSSCRPMR